MCRPKRLDWHLVTTPRTVDGLLHPSGEPNSIYGSAAHREQFVAVDTAKGDVRGPARNVRGRTRNDRGPAWKQNRSKMLALWRDNPDASWTSSIDVAFQVDLKSVWRAGSALVSAGVDQDPAVGDHAVREQVVSDDSRT